MSAPDPTGPQTSEPEPRRAAPTCDACGALTKFSGGVSTHDLYAERFVCPECGAETYRSFGRGSVS